MVCFAHFHTPISFPLYLDAFSRLLHDTASIQVCLFARAIDRKILALEATRDLTKTWAHVDMDAFYAAAEELANPSLV